MICIQSYICFFLAFIPWTRGYILRISITELQTTILAVTRDPQIHNIYRQLHYEYNWHYIDILYSVAVVSWQQKLKTHTLCIAAPLQQKKKNKNRTTSDSSPVFAINKSEEKKRRSSKEKIHELGIWVK